MTEPPRLETISWDEAWSAVRTLLPDAEYMTPGSLLVRAERRGMQKESLNFAFASDEEDASALRKVLAQGRSEEPVIVVTDCCFRDGWSPFVVRSSSSDAFAESYLALTGECVISGLDVVFIFPESRLLVLFHHEGQIALVS
jgi:hypothetical protein